MKKLTCRWGELWNGDAIACLKKMEANSVHLVVTSPPYWNLRDYQTGKYEGGDPKCDHDQTKKGTIRYRDRQGKNGGNNTHWQGASGHCTVKLGRTCVKCGAIRVKDNQMGSEETVEEYVAGQVAVFREVHRVFRDDGVLILNLGDTYGENKQQLLVPAQVALALQKDGWILRNDIPWLKRNPMPGSATDRFQTSTEHVFLFAKTSRYYFDLESIRQKGTGERQPISKGAAKARAEARGTTPSGNEKSGALIGGDTRNPRDSDLWFQCIEAPHGLVGIDDELVGLDVVPEMLKEKHYAAFPTKLVKPFVLAATSPKGCCPKCGKCWVRKTKKVRVATRPGTDSKIQSKEYKPAGWMTGPGSHGNIHKDGRRTKEQLDEQKNEAKKASVVDRLRSENGDVRESTYSEVVGNRDPQRHVTETKTVGWEPGCDCDAGDPVPCTVLDPFAGSGTSLIVAVRLKRRAVGIELAGELAKVNYFEMIRRRVNDAYSKRGLGE